MNITNKVLDIVMLPSNEKAVFGNLILTPTNPQKLLIFEHQRCTEVAQHLYIYSNDPIKLNNWVIDLESNTIFHVIEQNLSGIIRSTTDTFVEQSCRVIIATTNKLNFKLPEIREDSNYYLPTISSKFINEYIEAYNIQQTITKVLVEYRDYYVKGNYTNTCSLCKKEFDNTDKLGFICPNHLRLNINIDNTITIKSNTNYYKEELEKCKASPYYYATKYLTVDDKPFTTNYSEGEFNKKFYIKLLVKRTRRIY